MGCGQTINQRLRQEFIAFNAVYADKKKPAREGGFDRSTRVVWLRELDLNQRPSGYEPDELPGCSIPRQNSSLMVGYVTT
jgi:hypothetical protein